MPTEQFLNNLIINKVDTAETYEAMKANNLVNAEEIYLIENPVANYIKEVNKGAAQKFWRGTKEEFDAIAEKAEDTMYIVTDEDGGTVVEQVNADWNENNENSAAYVKNRPGAYSVFDEREIISETIFENPTWVDGCSEYDILISTNPRWLELTSDEITEVHVTFDGKLYVCKNENGRIGNAEIYGGSNTTNSDAPFAISVNAKAGSPYVALFTADEAANHTVRITSVVESVVKIPEKYLPDTVATKADIEAAIGAAISVSY